MEVESVLVTGANRGIGLEFVRQILQLSKPPRFVFATYRSDDGLKALRELKDSSKETEVVLIKLDVTQTDQLSAARKLIESKVGENGLNVLINNAGVAQYLSFPNLTVENLLHHFNVNTVGPVMVFQEMLPLLQKAAARKGSGSTGMSFSRAGVLNMTSMVGSITATGKEFLQDLAVPGYKMSKAALNMAMRVFAANIKDQGILVVNMCPGWVKTDMGTEQGQLEPSESIAAMLDTMSKLNESHHGTYMDRFAKPYQY